jgi:hypothetical protein
MTTLRDRTWLWGTKVNALEKFGLDESRMTIGQGLQNLGLKNSMMCGFLPPTEEEYAQVSHCENLLWEMSFDEGFEFERPLAPILDLHVRHPNVRGVLLDDFTSTEIDRGAKPDLLVRMREAMPESAELWIVAYLHNLDIPDISEYLKLVDGISFWVWHGRDLERLDECTAQCHEMSGGKPQITGLYFYDFGVGKQLTPDQMVMQLETGARLVESGASEGICLLGSPIMDIGLDTIDVTKNWLDRNGDRPCR